MALTGAAIGNRFAGSTIPGATEGSREELIAEHGDRSSHNSPSVVARLWQTKTAETMHMCSQSLCIRSNPESDMAALAMT